MPDVPRPDNVVSVLADLRSRVAKLESYPPNMVLVSRTTYTAASGLVYVSSFTELGGTLSAAYTLVRPLTILVLQTLSGFYGSGGTANYVTVRAVVGASFGAGPANDVNGDAMVSSQGYCVSNVGLANHCAPMCFVCPAGRGTAWGRTEWKA